MPGRTEDGRATPTYVWVPALIFSVCCLAFLCAAFFLRPTLSPDQRTILNYVFAFLAGTAAIFIGGAASIRLTGGWGGTKGVFSAAGGIAIFVYVLTHPLFKPEIEVSQDTPAETDLVAVKEQIANLRVYVESLANPDSVSKLETQAEMLAERILRIPEVSLSSRRVYMKYEYAAIAYAFAAAAYEHLGNRERVAKLSAMGIANADKALAYLGEVSTRSPTEAGFLVDWVASDNGKDRVLHFKAMCLCMKALATESEPDAQQAMATWEAISSGYRADFPADATPQLRCIPKAA